MVTIVAPLLVSVVGALLYAFGSAKVIELGRIMFFCGFFWLVYLLSGRAFRF